jgi:hypothetical protein
MTREIILEPHQNNNKVAAQYQTAGHHLNRSTKTAAGAKQHLQTIYF